MNKRQWRAEGEAGISPLTRGQLATVQRKQPLSFNLSKERVEIIIIVFINSSISLDLFITEHGSRISFPEFTFFSKTVLPPPFIKQIFS